uniref:TNFR-Cys domain-containing protein n=1 Tax=Lates calcarifer TaxID=8187 RepID=A0A4W6DFA0_LATCA
MKVFSGNSLTCHPAEYQTGNECCPMCPPGSCVKTNCTEFRSRSCLPCLEGTYMNQPTERTQCFPCTNCDAGSGLKIKTSCTSTSDTVCEPLEGFYCMDVKDKCCMAAQRHKHCEPGQYISKKVGLLSIKNCKKVKRNGSLLPVHLSDLCSLSQCPLLTVQHIHTCSFCPVKVIKLITDMTENVTPEVEVI